MPAILGKVTAAKAFKDWEVDFNRSLKGYRSQGMDMQEAAEKAAKENKLTEKMSELQKIMRNYKLTGDLKQKFPDVEFQRRDSDNLFYAPVEKSNGEIAYYPVENYERALSAAKRGDL